MELLQKFYNDLIDINQSLDNKTTWKLVASPNLITDDLNSEKFYDIDLEKYDEVMLQVTYGAEEDYIILPNVGNINKIVRMSSYLSTNAVKVSFYFYPHDTSVTHKGVGLTCLLVTGWAASSCSIKNVYVR